ncbi:MotA/TolQ/ExbB proton channel family protein [Wandonia haliotis]|uniref:MotA/TolQ/ExbB proton channel family protein n=1 Tax=Wandonia haliotis TaxID=574963 RepID=A0ABN1MM34_9FLAO
MRKVFSVMALAATMMLGTATVATANEEAKVEIISADQVDNMPVVLAQNEPAADADPATATAEEGEGLVYVLKEQFLTGGPLWMGIVLICLVLGVALAIERIIYLNISTINTRKFMNDVENALQSGGVEAAKELCRNTRGPIASIYYQGLDRADEGIEMVEKSVVSYGGVQMGLMEKGISWISLFIALAPMLGFMGTVIGMIQAFADIVREGTVAPTTVAGGIQVALLTTVFGLIAAIVLQIFYNYIIAKMDSLVNEMEDASISLVDMMLKYKVTSK